MEEALLDKPIKYTYDDFLHDYRITKKFMIIGGVLTMGIFPAVGIPFYINEKKHFKKMQKKIYKYAK